MLEQAALALTVAAVGLGLAAAALARVGLHHRAHRGWGHWVAALALAALALPLASQAQGSRALTALSWLLAMPWPLWTLAGVRAFHARLGLSAGPRIDLIVGLGAAAAVITAGTMLDASTARAVSAGALLLAQLYAAVMLWSSRTTEDGRSMRLLGTVAAASALAPVLHAALPNTAEAAADLTRMLAAAFGLALMAFTTIGLMNLRTERELRLSRRRLRTLAHVDALTGVPNRRRFHDRLRRVLQAEPPVPAVLLLFDIDHFKLINDRLGHAAGDRALRLVGRCMQDALRSQDLAGRLGGDEFALLLHGASVEQALGVAERIVTQMQLNAPRRHLPCLALSFGIAPLLPGEPLEDALHRADQALYEAKRQGRSRAVAVDGDDTQPQFVESRRLGLTPA